MTSLPRLFAFSFAAVFLLLGSFGCTSEEPAIQPVPPDAPDRFDRIADALDGRQMVLLGESSHGVADFYERKAALVRNVRNARTFFSFKYETDRAAGFPQMQALRDSIMAEN